MNRNNLICRVGILATCLVAFAVVGMSCGTAQAATLIAGWTFETNTPPDSTDAAVGPVVAAESGVNAAGSSMNGVHASALSDWTTPAGNGSANSYSVNTWTVGDYFEFRVVSTGYGDITLTWDQTSGAAGPRDFELFYKAGTDPFVSAGTYVVLPNQVAAPGAGVWNATTAISAYSYAADLSAISALDCIDSIVFRLVNYTTADATPPGLVAAAGTDRVDNFFVSGEECHDEVVPVPAGAFVFMGVAAVAGAARRRIQGLLS